MRLDETYSWAVDRLRAVGAGAVADRFKSAICGFDLDRSPVCVAILAAVDAVDCRRAAVLDPVNARRWEAIAEDQAQISRTALALQRVEVERRGAH